RRRHTRFSRDWSSDVCSSDLEPILEKYRRVFTIQIEGQSEELRNIYSIRIGTGSYKVLLWSQMHGNETTTTKALIDFLQFLNIRSEERRVGKESMTYRHTM